MYNEITHPDFRKGLSLQELEMKKTDKTLRKLNLSTETLRNLDESHLEAVNGGASFKQSNCAICTSTCP
jgi:hypothetical protein